jgi:hypothetical protein
MAQVLSFALRLSEAKTSDGDHLLGCPEGAHDLLRADRTLFCLLSGSATQFRGVARQIELARTSVRRKWSNARCTVCSYAIERGSGDRIGRAIVSIGRDHLSSKIACATFSRNPSNPMFSRDDFLMSHLALGYVLDLLEPRLRIPNMTIEMADRESRRLQGGGASLLSARVERFLASS